MSVMGPAGRAIMPLAAMKQPRAEGEAFVKNVSPRPLDKTLSLHFEVPHITSPSTAAMAGRRSEFPWRAQRTGRRGAAERA